MSIDPKASYYDAGGIETMAIIKAKLTPDGYVQFLLGNAIKYMTRVNFKNPENKSRDAEKCAFYSQLYSEEIKKYEAKK